MTRAPRLATALASAALCHALFVLAVGSMAYALANGLQNGRGALSPTAGRVCDLLLAVQFPLVHSWLLTRTGRRFLAAIVPFGRRLGPTAYVILASLQLLATFWLWTPSGEVWDAPHGRVRIAAYCAFAGAWLFLGKALFDAGLMLQSGAAGWWALLRDRPVDYGTMATHGLFARCRQPIYLGFALVLWTAPLHSPDWLLLTLAWSAYCVAGPRLKEARWTALFGDRFRSYRATVPYFLPRLFR